MKDDTIHELWLNDPTAVEALISHLGLSLDRRALRMLLVSTQRWRTAVQILVIAPFLFLCGALAVGGALGAPDESWLTSTIFVSMIVPAFGAVLAIRDLLARLSHGEVVVGLDGVFVRTKGTSRYIPISGLAEASAVGSTVVIGLQPGNNRPSDSIEFAIAGESDTSASGATAVANAIREAIALYEARPMAGGANLDRGKKSQRAWREDLGRALRVDPAYRSARLGSEELGALVDDASAPPDRRVGAALALASHSPDEARERVRIAATAIADGDLRASLEAAAEGEIDERSLRRSMRLHGRSS
jgi:hypothetical protein